MTFAQYMVDLVTKKPTTQRWGQWAMNLLALNANVLDPILQNIPKEFDVWELDDMKDPRFARFLEQIETFF